MRTICIFYSPGLGGSWHIHNATMDPGSNHRIVHVFVGEPLPDLLATVTDHGLEYVNIPYRSGRDLLRAVLDARRTLRNLRVDIVHGHGIEGTLIGLAAGLLSGVTDRIHTRHHATMHHETGPWRALLADRLVNRLSTTIIATCDNVRDCLVSRERVDPAKIRVLELRLDVEGFGNVTHERIAEVRSRHSLSSTRFIVGMVSRLVWWKGVEHGVEAFAHYVDTNPDALLVLVGAVGPHREVVQTLLDTVPECNYQIIEYEKDIGALYSTFDVLMHLPVTPGVEAWGQVYVEAMAAGVPLVCTRSGIGNELLVDGENCIVVNYRDADSTHEGLIRLASDSTLRLSLVENAKTSALRYARTPDLNTLDFLYSSASAC